MAYWLFKSEPDVFSWDDLVARGVEFTEAPEQRPYGIDAGFRDPSGNGWKMIEARRAPQ
mgnify:CR=1 FL=1